MSGRALATAISALLAAAALVVALPGAAFGGSAAAASNSKTFKDSVGEDANAPDITTIGVSNSDAGLITFKINISNRPALTPDMAIVMFLNTDGKTSTGDAQSDGADYVIQVAQGEAALFRWNGKDFVFASSTLSFSYASTGATLRIGAQDLGATKAIAFSTLVVSGAAYDTSGNVDCSHCKEDAAPDQGTYAYPVLTKLTLSVVGFATSPKRARAGGPFSVGLAAEENDMAGPVSRGSVTCAARVAGQVLRTARRGTVANGIAACAWVLPRGGKGKTIRGSITLLVQGVHVTRAFAARIS